MTVDSSKWPKNVRMIGLEGLDHIGVDDSNRLYWDGNRLQTGVALTRWQTTAAIITVLSLVATGLHDLIELFGFLGWMTLVK